MSMSVGERKREGLHEICMESSTVWPPWRGHRILLLLHRCMERTGAVSPTLYLSESQTFHFSSVHRHSIYFFSFSHQSLFSPGSFPPLFFTVSLFLWPRHYLSSFHSTVASALRRSPALSSNIILALAPRIISTQPFPLRLFHKFIFE